MAKKKPIILDFTQTQQVEELFNEAFQHPRRHYIVQPVDAEVAAEWLKDSTSMVNFVWCGGVKSFEKRLAEAGPLHSRQLIGLDMLYHRDRCGWGSGSDHCDHPSQADGEFCHTEHCEELPAENHTSTRGCGKRLCFSFNCPIAHEADREDIKKLDPGLYRSDYQGNEDEPED